MVTLFAHSTATLFESLPDLGVALVVLSASVLIVRYSIRICRSSLRNEPSTRLVLKLFAVSGFAGFCGVARVALYNFEWQRMTVVFEYDPYYTWTSYSRLAFSSIYAALFVASLGFALAFLSMNVKAMCKSRLGRALIRWRIPIIVVVSLALAATYSYNAWLKPAWNRESLLLQLGESDGLSAYLDPKEVLLFKVIHEEALPPSPPSQNSSEAEVLAEEKLEWDRVASRYRGYRINHAVERLEPGDAKRKLDELFVYKSVAANGYANSQYLLRFIGETSVLDLWFCSFQEIEVFSSKALSDLPYILTFTKPYDEVMKRTVGEGLKYLAPKDHWIHGFFREPDFE